ncbi:MAG: hypothetical protein WCB99_06555 [Candidatus Cybelea sp.]
MKASDASPYAPSFCAMALLVACGGSQPPIGAPGAGSRALASATHAEHGMSWMSPRASGSDLLYVSTTGYIFVYTYPGGESVGTLSGRLGENGLCSDSAGNVFTSAMSDSGESSAIYEYAHGGTSPIATLSDPGIAFGCAFDPTSGNLAVANFEDYNNRGDVGDIAVYASEKGTPKIYCCSFFRNYFCAYDGKGDLYVTGDLPGRGGLKPVIGRLRKGGSFLAEISLSRKLFWASGEFYPSVQWDGHYVTLSSIPKKRTLHPNNFEFAVYRLNIRGSKATIVGATTFKTGGRNYHVGQVSIQDKTVLTPYIKRGQRVGFWAYPGGGSPNTAISVPAFDRLWGLTISVYPSGAHVRNNHEKP